MRKRKPRYKAVRRDKRTVNIHVRLTESESKRLEQLAAAVGETLSAYIRRYALGNDR